MSQHTHKNPIEEARLLLPWYITGKLGEAEKALVDAALKQYPVLQEEYVQELKLVETIRLNADLLTLTAMDTSQQRLDKLLKRIEREETPRIVEPVVQAKPTVMAKPRVSVWQIVQHWLADWVGSNGMWKPANVVFASLLAVQVGVLSVYYLQPKTIYETVTYEDTSVGLTKAKNLVVFIDFNKNASVTTLHDFLKQRNARVIDGPDSNNLFKVEFKNTQTLSEMEIKQRIKQLELEQTVVSFVGREF